MVVPTGGPAGAAAQAQPAPAGLSAPVEKPANRLMTWLLALVTVFVALLFFSFQVEVGNIIGLVYLVLLALTTIPHPTLDKAWPAVKPAYITIAFIQTIISTLVIYDGLNYSWNLELIIPGILTAAGGPVIAVLLFIGAGRSSRQPDAAPGKIEAPAQAAGEQPKSWGVVQWLLIAVTLLNTAAVLFLGSWFWPVDFGLVITMMIPVALLVTIFLPALAEARRFLRFFFAVYCLWMVIFAVFNSYLWVPAGFVVMLILLQLDRTRDPIPAVNKGKG